MSNNKSEDKYEFGCGIIIAVVFFGGVIINFIQSLLATLIPIAILGAIGYLAYKAESDRSAISNGLSNLFDSLDKNKEDSPRKGIPPRPETMELPAPATDSKMDILIDKFSNMEDKLDRITRENEELKERIRQQDEQMLEEKKGLVDYFKEGVDPNFSKSKEAIKKKHKKRIEQKEHKLDQQIYEQKINEKVLQMKEEVHEVKHEVAMYKVDVENRFIDVKVAVDKIDMKYHECFLYVNKRIDDEHTYFESKTMTLEHVLQNTYHDLNGKINNNTNLISKVNNNLTVKIDGNTKSIGQLKNNVISMLNTQNGMINEVKHNLKEVDFRSKTTAWESQKRMEKTDLLIQRSANREEVLKGAMNNYLEKISLHDQKFAIQARELSSEINYKRKEVEMLAKDVGYKELGINALRKDFEQRQQNAVLQLTSKANEIKSMQQLYEERNKNSQQTFHLEGKLNEARSDYRYMQQRENLMRRETTLVKELSKHI